MLAFLILSLSALTAPPPSAPGPEQPAAATVDLPVAPQVPKSVTFAFRAAAETGRARLFLGDLAVCMGAPAICDEAYGVDLGPSPQPGRTALIPVEKLKVLLEREWPGAEVSLDAPKSIKVTALQVPLDEDSVVSELKAALAAKLGEADGFTAAVIKATINQMPKLRQGSFHVEFPDLNEQHLKNAEWVRKNLAGNQRLAAACVMTGEDAAVLPFSVTASLELKEKLPVPNRDLNKGDVIQAQDLADQWVEITRGAQYAHDAKALVGRRLKRAAPAYLPLLPTQVEIPRVVRRGQLVRLIMNGNGVDVSSQVTALENAAPGQAIEAQYPATKKKFKVRVIDGATVEYLF